MGESEDVDFLGEEAIDVYNDSSSTVAQDGTLCPDLCYNYKLYLCYYCLTILALFTVNNSHTLR
jgi:hypothetical protein